MSNPHKKIKFCMGPSNDCSCKPRIQSCFQLLERNNFSQDSIAKICPVATTGQIFAIEPSWIFNLHIHKKKLFPKIIPAKFQPHWRLNGSKISDKNDFLTGIKVIILDGDNLGFFIHIKNENFVRDHLVINRVQLGLYSF